MKFLTQRSSSVSDSAAAVFVLYPAPVVRNVGTERELTMMRWGMPPPPKIGVMRALNRQHPPAPEPRRKRAKAYRTSEGGSDEAS